MAKKNAHGRLAVFSKIASALLSACFVCLCIACAGHAGAETESGQSESSTLMPSRQENVRAALIKATALAPAQEDITGMFIPFGPGTDNLTAKGFALVKDHDYTRIIILAGTDDNSASLAVFPEIDSEKAPAEPDAADSLNASGNSGEPVEQLETSEPNKPGAPKIEPDLAGIAALQKALPAPKPPRPQKGQKPEDVPPVIPQVGPSANVLELPAMRSVLPFVAEAFPECPVLPLALNRSTTPKQWEALTKALKPLAQGGKKQKTLVIYVGNASSGLDLDDSRKSDQETMRVLASRNPKLVQKMSEPGHVDSLASLYILISLQNDTFKSVATVLDNVSVYGKQIESLPAPVKRVKKEPAQTEETPDADKATNADESAATAVAPAPVQELDGAEAPSSEKSTSPSQRLLPSLSLLTKKSAGETTPCPNPIDDNKGDDAESLVAEEMNHILAVYAKNHLPVTAGAARYFAGGDFFTGRNMKALLANPTRRELMVSRILERTGGHPLIVNFEGVLMDPDEPDPLSRRKAKLPEGGMRLWMPREDTLDIMAELNIVAVSIANNHTYDFGAKAYARNQQELEEAGFLAAGQGEFRELSHFILAASTDCDNNRSPYAPILTKEDLAPLTEASPKFKKPIFASTHCGNEYKYKPNDRVREVAKMMEKAGAEVFIGHHPHMTGPYEATLNAYQFWSLGNFLFDQLRSDTDGALLEIVFFNPGTYWIMQHPAENMFRNYHKK